MKGHQQTARGSEAPREHHLSELKAERLLAGELAGEALAEVMAHIEACGSCGRYVEALRTSDAEVRQQRPPMRVTRLPAARARSGGSTRRWGRAVGPPLAVFGAVAAVLIAVWWLPPDVPEGGADGSPAVEPDQVRSKGTGLGFEVYVKAEGGPRLVTSGDAVAPGDAIGFRIRSDFNWFFMIVGRDEAGGVYLCHPQTGQSGVLQAKSEGEDVEQAMELDGILGRERFVLLVCPSPFTFQDVDEVLRGARPDEGFGSLPLLRGGCQQREVVLHKLGARGE